MDEDKIFDILEKIQLSIERLRKDFSLAREGFAVHIAESVPVRQQVDKHERQLNGTNGRKALVARVDNLEEKVERLEKEIEQMKTKEDTQLDTIRRVVIGVFVTGIMSAIGYGIIHILSEAIGK